ncbi:MAG: NarK/NasA family nitrate transporter [Deltaproteobacteria bacterium]|nr:NarK/NasA family nitrate transporter [Deltaproteobacteria bacterium]
MKEDLKGFWKAGHLPTLITAFIYFDVCFSVWVVNGAMAPFISEEFHLSAAQKGFMISVPVIAGALMRFPLGILAQYIGRKRAAMLEMSVISVSLVWGYFFTTSLGSVVAMGVALGMAGASFGVALSLGSGSYPPKYKGLAMGIAGAGNSGTVIAMLAAPPLAHAYGWRTVYLLGLIPMVLAMVLLQIFAKEPSDREVKKLGDYLKILVDRDAWVFNLMYSVTFGGFIGLANFLPTLFHDHYAIPKQSVGIYVTLGVVAASGLRVVGGWLADHMGGLRVLYVLFGMILLSTLGAATMPANPWVMAFLVALAMGAMGAGNGAVFQLVPLRFRAETAVAGSLIGEIGALAGGFLPNAMGLGKQHFDSFTPGFLGGAALTVLSVATLAVLSRSWTHTWVGKGGRARVEPPSHEERGKGVMS